MRLGRLAGLSAGHLVADLNQGAVVILVPLVKVGLGLSIGAAALLVTVSTVTSSLVQPAFGVISDRFDVRWMIPLGVVLGAVGTAAAALAPTYPLVVVGVLVGGLGIAAFHPEASRWAGEASGPQRATGMSYFAVGGNLGYGLGILALAPVVVRSGRGGAALLLIPAAALGALLTAMIGRFGRSPSASRGQPVVATLAGALTPDLLLLLGVVSLRSGVSIGTAALVTLYLHLQRGLGLAEAATLASLYLIAGAAGTIFGGPLADRFGRRRQMLGSFLLQPPLFFGFLLFPGPAGYACLFLLGAVCVSTFSVTLAVGQELSPRQQGTAAGLIFGFAFGAGGLVAGGLGALADHIGLGSTLIVLAVLPALGIPLILALRETGGSGAEPSPRLAI